MIDVTPAESPTEPEQVTVTCDSKQAAG
jgi:hypothetical protein